MSTTTNDSEHKGDEKGKRQREDKDESFDLPHAVVQRILKNALPDGVQVQKDAKLAVEKAAKIFINYVTACANDFALHSNRRTILSKDVLSAMEELEFADFIPKLKLALEAFEKENADKAAAKKDRSEKDKSEKDKEDENEKDESKKDNEEVEEEDDENIDEDGNEDENETS
eukprot:TRINITY_DN8768_c0_g1_i1.p1 TRINITY_DN8768_c0_g1~~TRINITY_DN8768_c0_g1_i1.p1  ORF type:complete len:192 (-),score=65.43 TRINITY_DN8768_c0_g1_i1:161-676(-)